MFSTPSTSSLRQSRTFGASGTPSTAAAAAASLSFIPSTPLQSPLPSNAPHTPYLVHSHPGANATLSTDSAASSSSSSSSAAAAAAATTASSSVQTRTAPVRITVSSHTSVVRYQPTDLVSNSAFSFHHVNPLGAASMTTATGTHLLNKSKYSCSLPLFHLPPSSSTATSTAATAATASTFSSSSSTSTSSSSILSSLSTNYTCGFSQFLAYGTHDEIGLVATLTEDEEQARISHALFILSELENEIEEKNTAMTHKQDKINIELPTPLQIQQAIALDPAPKMATAKHEGVVKDLKFLTDRIILTGSSTGHLNTYELQSSTVSSSLTSNVHVPAYSLAHTSSKLLHDGALNSLSVQMAGSAPLAATTGDDGRLCFVAPFQKECIRTIDHAIPGAGYKVAFAGTNVLLCGMSSQLFSYDPRSSSNKPALSFNDPNSFALTALAIHPSRPHIVATGSVDGLLSIWDIRTASSSNSMKSTLSSVPICSIAAHATTVHDVCFLPLNPTAVLTAGEDGAVCLFDFNKQRLDPVNVTYSATDSAQINFAKIAQFASTGHALNSIDVWSNQREIALATGADAIVLLKDAF